MPGKKGGRKGGKGPNCPHFSKDTVRNSMQMKHQPFMKMELKGTREIISYLQEDDYYVTQMTKPTYKANPTSTKITNVEDMDKWSLSKPLVGMYHRATVQDSMQFLEEKSNSLIT